jgi:hypothetical protein
MKQERDLLKMLEDFTNEIKFKVSKLIKEIEIQRDKMIKRIYESPFIKKLLRRDSEFKTNPSEELHLLRMNLQRVSSSLSNALNRRYYFDIISYNEPRLLQDFQQQVLHFRSQQENDLKYMEELDKLKQLKPRYKSISSSLSKFIYIEDELPKRKRLAHLDLEQREATFYYPLNADAERFRFFIPHNMIIPHHYSHASIQIKHQIFMCGGSAMHHLFLNSSYMLDEISCALNVKEDMHVGKRHHAIANLNNNILYTAGGEGVLGYLQICEKYDVRLDKWSLTHPMNVPKKSAALCAFDGYILYCFGGWNGGLLNDIEVLKTDYDPQAELAKKKKLKKHFSTKSMTHVPKFNLASPMSMFTCSESPLKKKTLRSPEITPLSFDQSEKGSENVEGMEEEKKESLRLPELDMSVVEEEKEEKKSEIRDFSPKEQLNGNEFDINKGLGSKFKASLMEKKDKDVEDFRSARSISFEGYIKKEGWNLIQIDRRDWPGGKQMCSIALDNQRILLFGGYRNKSWTNECFVYIVPDNQFLQFDNMDDEDFFTSKSVIKYKNQIYSVGNLSNTIHKFCANSMTWNSLPESSWNIQNFNKGEILLNQSSILNQTLPNQSFRNLLGTPSLANSFKHNFNESHYI